MKNAILILVCCWCFISQVEAQRYFDWNEGVADVYSTILDLRLNDAQIAIHQLSLQEPDNALIPLLKGYSGFLEVFISEEEQAFKEFKKAKKQWMKAIKEGELDSPFYLFGQAQLHLQSALVRLKFQEYFGAFNEVSNAYELLSYNQKKYPDFLPNKVSLALLKSMVGTVPDSYRWGIKLLGLDGNLEAGIKELKDVLGQIDSNRFLLKEEAQVATAMALLHLAKKPEEAWAIVQGMDWSEEQSLLAAFIKANVARRTGRNDTAIGILTRRPEGEAYRSFHYLEYMLGEAKLHKLDAQAKSHFLHFIDQFKGKNYLKDACKKMGWYELIFNQGNEYADWKTRCKTIGSTQVDADKSALQWAKSNENEHLGLLKVRLLYDGGYYREAASLLEDLAGDKLSGDQRLEYYYRKAQVAQAQERYDEAIKAFDLVLGHREESTRYIIGNAALQMGFIHEQLGDNDQAYYYYKMCKDIDVDQYQSSLNQKARAGMERVGD